MKTIPVDLDALRQELEDKRRAASSRSRALDELSEAISGDLTMAKVWGYIQLLADTSNHVAKHLADITLSEVLEHGGDAPKDNSKRRRATKAQVDRGYQALMQFFKGTKDKLSKSDIYGSILTTDPGVDADTLNAAWDRIRPHLHAEGKNLRHMVYWLPARSKK